MATDPPSPRGRALERLLRLFTDVRHGEASLGLLLLGGAFLVLAAYYFIKPAREGFLAASELQGLTDVELKAYTSVGQSLALLVVLPLYDRLLGRWSRRQLVTWVPVFFAANLCVFWLLRPGLVFSDPPLAGVAFYLWVGIFNVFIVAHFWSFVADLYSDERGRRLFPLIAFGATAGAASGAALARRLVELTGIDAYGLLLVAAGILLVSIAILRAADTSGQETPSRAARAGKTAAGGEVSGGLRLIREHRYLLAVAGLMLFLNWVNTNGENLLFGVVQAEMDARVAERGLEGAAAEELRREETTAFYGDFYFRVNLLALFLQAFVASRILRWGGFGPLLLLLPVISLISYGLMAAFPVLAVVRNLKTAENATDYSIHNTARQVLWLPTTAAMKYRAKAAIDTLFVRFGDVAAALTAFVGIHLLTLPLRSLFAFNATLALAWLAIGVVVVREHRRLAAGQQRVRKDRPSA